jgi:hypothetical protein
MNLQSARLNGSRSRNFRCCMRRSCLPSLLGGMGMSTSFQLWVSLHNDLDLIGLCANAVTSSTRLASLPLRLSRGLDLGLVSQALSGINSLFDGFLSLIVSFRFPRGIPAVVSTAHEIRDPLGK